MSTEHRMDDPWDAGVVFLMGFIAGLAGGLLIAFAVSVAG